VPPGVHGPIVVSSFKGQPVVNRIYMPYGVGSDGIHPDQRPHQGLAAAYGSGVYANPARPTDAELLQGQIGVVYMPGAEAATRPCRSTESI